MVVFYLRVVRKNCLGILTKSADFWTPFMRDSDATRSGGVVDGWTQEPEFLTRSLGDMSRWSADPMLRFMM